MNIFLMIMLIAIIAGASGANAVIMIDLCNEIRDVSSNLENIAKEINEHENT